MSANNKQFGICPWCNDKGAPELDHHPDGKFVVVFCSNCGASGPLATDEEHAVKAWNDSAVSQHIERMWAHAMILKYWQGDKTTTYKGLTLDDALADSSRLDWLTANRNGPVKLTFDGNRIASGGNVRSAIDEAMAISK